MSPSRAPLALMLLLAASTGAPGADEPAAAATSDASAKQRHSLSSDTAAKLAALAPKFTPPPETPAEPRPPARVPAETKTTDDSDKPRNQIIRLPSYLVQDYRISNYKERYILTPQAKIDLQFKKLPGLHIGNLFGLNQGIAAFMLWEEERLERMREMQDLAGLMSYGPPDEFKKVKREVQKAFIREPDFGR